MVTMKKSSFIFLCWIISAHVKSIPSENSGIEVLSRSVRAIPATAEILLYKNVNFGGESLQFRVPYGNHCVDLPSQWDNQAVSIDPGASTCVIVFADAQCTGKGVRLQNFTYGTMNLEDIGLKRVVSSARLFNNVIAKNC